MRSRRKWHCWKINRSDQLAGCEIRIPLRRVARQTMKIAERDLPFAIRSAHAHNRLERGQRDTHVARVSCDALVTLTENRVNTIVAIKSAAAGAGFAFVACRKRRIVKIITTRPLQKIAADGCHVAQLWTGAGKERFS